MIVGHGIDLQDIAAVEQVYRKKPRFAQRVLTPSEFEQFKQKPEVGKMTYLAGRWAAKEAFSKAMGTGIGKQVGFQDLSIAATDKGAPYFAKMPFDGKAWLSITHSAGLVQASVILEEEK